MIDCLDPPENPEVAYFSSSLALNLFLFLSSLPPFNLCIIFATKLTSICLCLSHFVSVFVHLLLSYRIFSNIKSLFYLATVFYSPSVSPCLCLSLSCCSVIHIIQYWRCRLGTSRLLPTPENTPLAEWACVEAQPLSHTDTHAHTQITRWGLRQHIVSVTAKLIRHTRKDTCSGTCFQEGTCHTHAFSTSSNCQQSSPTSSLCFVVHLPPKKPPSSVLLFVILLYSWEAITVSPGLKLISLKTPTNK